MKTVTLNTFQHKEEECIGITFPYDNEVKEKVKSIAGVKWSQTHKTFYVLAKNTKLQILFKSLQNKGLYVDYNALVVTAKSNKKASIPKRDRTLSEANKEVLRAFVNYLKGLRLSESTVKTYFTFVAAFIDFVAEKPLEDLDNTDVRLFVEKQVAKKRYSISTHRQLVSAIKHFATFYPSCHITGEDLIRPKKSKYLPTVLSQQEIIDLLRATKNLKHRTVIALLYSSGLRIGELISLQLAHIDIDRRQVIIKNAKGRKDRVVIMAESFVPLLKNYLMTYRPAKFFIEGQGGKEYSPVSIRSFLKRSCKEAGIAKRVSPHTLRHSYATHLIEDGVGLRHVQDLLGHAKPETTMIYTHVAKKDLLRIRSPLDSALLALKDQDKSNNKPFLSQNNSG